MNCRNHGRAAKIQDFYKKHLYFQNLMLVGVSKITQLFQRLQYLSKPGVPQRVSSRQSLSQAKKNGVDI